MDGAEVAEVSGGYAPGGWQQENMRLVVRRVRVNAADLHRSPKARRRRSVPKGQLKLLLRGRIEHTYAAALARAADPEAVVAEVTAGRSHNPPFIRRWLINLPARILRSARQRYLRMPPGWQAAIQFQALYYHLLALPSG
ncbi:MAG TPA: hypothetical protein VMU49_02545 [Candidatus Acidoferrales bacterium]|nr:hypothetical protein [Candidatus Acidoferrales bacterium]